MNIKKLFITDIKEIVNIHLKAFEGFFLSSLGKKFLSAYYKACLKSNDCIAVGISNNENQMMGFAIGCIKASGFHKRLLIDNIFSFGLQALILIFTKFQAICRLLKNLEKNKNVDDDGNYGELLSIAILPEFKGQGVGKLLIQKFEEDALNRSCKKIALTTDYFNNDDVISFYFKSGYKIFYKFTAYPNREMYKLIKDL